MTPEELQHQSNIMTYLCSLEILRDDLKAAFRESEIDKAIRILKEISRFTAQYIRILEARQ